MTLDLDQLNKSLDQIIKPQIDNPLNETEMYFERLHLSPLKVRFVSKISLDFHSFSSVLQRFTSAFHFTAIHNQEIY